MSNQSKTPAPGSEEGFLARWSRMKRSVPEDAGPQALADEARTQIEPPIDLSKLPRIEDLTATSDLAQFLQKGVPEELRRLALRKGWTLDPAISEFIEVAENQYNWNDPNGVPGFGPLPPGTDIAALLRQAIGAQPLPSEISDPPVIEDAGLKEALQHGAEIGAVDGTEREASQYDESLVSGEPAPPMLSLTASAPAQDAIEASLEQQLTAVHKRSRRRHGGALPRA